VFFPLGLAATIFSTQGVLPFTPNLARFTGVLLILSVLVMATLVFLFNWASWIQPILKYLKGLRKTSIYYSDSLVTPAGRIRDPSTPLRVLEEGTEMTILTTHRSSESRNWTEKRKGGFE
jgi:hypothetical protein